MKRLKVISQNNAGLNTEFKDLASGEILKRGEVVKRIRAGDYKDYHLMKHIDPNTKKVKWIPRSNPDGIEKNNLG